MQTRNIGLIGLGTIGRQVGEKLLRAGHSLVVMDLDPARKAHFTSLGAGTENLPAQLAARAEVIILALPNSRCNADVVEGPNGLLEGIRPGTLLVDVGTSLPHETLRLGALLATKGARMVDSPTSFGPQGMCFMVGGAETDVAEARPLLEAIGTPVTHMGGLSHGHVTKLAQNMIRALNVAAVAEAFAFANTAGVDGMKLWEAIRASSSQSFALDKDAPLMVQRKFDGAGQLALHFKDNTYMLEAARHLGAATPLTGQMHEVLKILATRCGGGGWSTVGFVRYWELLNQTEMGSTKNEPR